MQRIMMRVAYDGTDYCGWQVQPNGVTIEEKLNEALTELLGEEIRVIGASRTDAGVHALGAVAIFDTTSAFPADKISFALNARLPEDIVVQQSKQVAADWHPRYAASRKTYEYRILNRTFADPTRRRDTYFFHRRLDVAKMQEAAAVLIGEHDFESFASIHRTADTTVRTLYECNVTCEGDLIRIRVTGNGFLYNMVRIIAGTLIGIGTGELARREKCMELSAKDFMGKILAAKNREMAGATAPAHGLTMIATVYDEEP